LVARGVVTNRLWFKLVARLTGADRSIQAGVYEFPAGASATQVLRTLEEGRAVALRFTVPEGLTVAEIAALAEERLGVPADSVVVAARDPALIEALGVPGAGPARSLEGFLLPETYLLPVDIGGRELVRIMAEHFVRGWDPAWDARLDTLGLSRLELTALASIVEGEARHDDERAIIAGVYHNRLRRRMPLQADPTVQYAIQLKTGRRKSRLFEKDYLIDSPYNTYLHPGLPPGPVCAPGRKSLVAALYPADVPYLFFVARPDGRHVFTRTYDEHLRAVAAVRRMPRDPGGKGSAPAGGH
ncbi:MAG TPA: endolytic transglycosylase MltG, partial [Gemmatimonadales bacterium]|nr:endolytic transglycosylase MltG [Gemmatimonadales bacterium]